MRDLKGRVFRTELKVWILIFAPVVSLRDWRQLNDKVRTLAENKPSWSPKRITNHFLKRWPSIKRTADEVASPFGTAKDVLLEQAQYWREDRERLLPDDDPWLRWAWLCCREIDPTGEVDLEPRQIQAVSGRIRGYSFGDIGSLVNASKTSAHRWWRQFLKAVEGGECHCGSSHCSMNKQDARASIVARLDAKSKGLVDLAFHPPAGKVPRGGVGGRGAIPDLARANPAYRVENVNAGMEIHAHRLTWIRHYGRIPSEHEIHHVDGDPANNDIDNLALLPRWIHEACHLVAKAL